MNSTVLRNAGMIQMQIKYADTICIILDHEKKTEMMMENDFIMEINVIEWMCAPPPLLHIISFHSMAS